MSRLTVVVYKSDAGSEFFVLAKSRKNAQAYLDSTDDTYEDCSFNREITVDEARQLGCGLINNGIEAIESGASPLGYMIASPTEVKSNPDFIHKAIE